jgi:hypothetical protein
MGLGSLQWFCLRFGYSDLPSNAGRVLGDMVFTGGSQMMRLISGLLIIWFIIGAAAAYQRNYFSGPETNCAKAGTIAVTVLAGPLNYVGVNPKIASCTIPQPSK